MKRLLLIIVLIMVIFQMVAISANLFADGFESGDLTAWSSSATDGGDLSAHADAKLHGSYGLKCVIDDITAIYVRDNTPNAETRYRGRFYVNPNSLTMANNTGFGIYKASIAGDTSAFEIQLYYTTVGGYKIGGCIKDDGGTLNYLSSYYAISNAVHCIEVDFIVASVGGNNGSIQLFIDGVSKETKGSIDNDTKTVATILTGVPVGVDVNISGTFYLDDFASNNDGGAIGMLGDNAIMFGINF